jgi:hypothetical protein
MRVFEEIKELLDIKNEALDIAIKALGAFQEKCDGESETPKNCEGDYHYRGCETKLGPILKTLLDAKSKN